MKLSDSKMIDLIRSVDPDPGDSSTPPTEVLHQRARRLTISAAPNHPARQTRRRWSVRPVLIAAAGVAGLALVIPALIPSNAPEALAATPPVLSFTPDARNGKDLLRSMAAGLRKQPGTPQATRQRGAVLSSEGYALVTSVSGNNSTSAWFSKKTSAVIQIDGATGRGTTQWTSEESEPHFATEADRRTWVDSGAGGGTGREVRTVPTSPELTAWYTQPPLRKEALLNKLFNGQPDRSTFMLLTGIKEQLGNAVLEPAQRADLLDELAARDDVHYVGSTVDRADRPAYGFAYETDRSGLPTRDILLISPDGNLLSYEEVLTRDAGGLNVSIPATLTYTLYLSSRYR
jgi:hypothetical protein